MPDFAGTFARTLPFVHEVAQGAILGSRIVNILGYNAAVQETLADLAELGVDVTPVPSSAIAMEVVSSSADDAAAGTGIRTVMVHGLDSAWAIASATMTMNGTTAAAVPGTWIRVNNLHAVTVGSNGVAVGNVSLQAAGGGVEYGRIGAGGNMTLQCHYTIPDGQKGHVLGWSAGAGTTASAARASRAILRATVSWYTRTLLPGVFNFQDIMLIDQSTGYSPFQAPLLLPPKCDLKISAQRVGGAGTTAAAGMINLFLTPE